MARMRVQLLGHQLENLSASLDQRHAITFWRRRWLMDT